VVQTGLCGATIKLERNKEKKKEEKRKKKKRKKERKKEKKKDYGVYIVYTFQFLMIAFNFLFLLFILKLTYTSQSREIPFHLVIQYS
jgi:hypothetical protein